MKCEGCGKPATHLVFEILQPHCTSCMIDAMCSVPTEVIDIESWEAKKREQRVGEVA